MYSHDELFLCSLRCYFGVYCPHCFTTREINTKRTFPWELKQFFTQVHTLFSLYKNQNQWISREVKEKKTMMMTNCHQLNQLPCTEELWCLLLMIYENWYKNQNNDDKKSLMATTLILIRHMGGYFNIKTSYYQYRNSHQRVRWSLDHVIIKIWDTYVEKYFQNKDNKDLFLTILSLWFKSPYWKYSFYIDMGPRISSCFYIPSRQPDRH